MLLAFDWSQLAQQTVIGLSSGGTWALLALAIVLIYRSTGVVNFAQGEMATFATYITWTLMDHGLGFWPAFALTPSSENVSKSSQPRCSANRRHTSR